MPDLTLHQLTQRQTHQISRILPWEGPMESPSWAIFDGFSTIFPSLQQLAQLICTIARHVSAIGARRRPPLDTTEA
jgi:hypothetical protein